MVPDPDFVLYNMADLSIVTTRLMSVQPSWPLKLLLFAVFLFTGLPGAFAQSVIVMVNDEPITSYDVAQREHFLALTSGFGDRMRARLGSEQTKQAFQAYMSENQPQSREEAQALQKKFVAQIEKEVVASASSAKRQEAIDQLIDEHLMLQAAKEQKVTVSDEEVNKVLTRMAQGGSKKNTLQEFLAQFQAQGINPSTLKFRIRAQTAWREVIRQLYGSRVRAAVPANERNALQDSSGTKVDVEIVKLTMPAKADQNAVARRLVEADQLRKGFSSCAALAKQVKGLSGVSLESVKKADINDFRGEVRAALAKAKAGEMTPPVIVGGTIESHAVCSKTVAATSSGKNEKKAEARDQVQEEFQLYSKRHLKDLKDRALLKYPKSG